MHSRHEKLKELIENYTPVRLDDLDKKSAEEFNSAPLFGHEVASNPKDAMGSTKAPLSLLTPSFLEGVARAMEYGAFKAKRKDGGEGYGAYNWRTTTVRLSVYTDAILRHAAALADGEDLDKDSGLPHEDHIAANVNIIKDAKKYNMVDNDLLTYRKK